MRPLSSPENPLSIRVEHFPLLWFKGGKSQGFVFNSSSIALNENIQEHEKKVHQISHKTCSHIFPLSLIQKPQNSVSPLLHLIEITLFVSQLVRYSSGKLPFEKEKIDNQRCSLIRVFSRAFLPAAWGQRSCKRLNAATYIHCILLGSRSKFLCFVSACTSTGEIRCVQSGRRATFLWF